MTNHTFKCRKCSKEVTKMIKEGTLFNAICESCALKVQIGPSIISESTINLKLTNKEADLLFEILTDANVYHENTLEQYTRLDDYEIREGFFDKERLYRTEASDLSVELIQRLGSALGKKE